jgi:putative flippase GtrA
MTAVTTFTRWGIFSAVGVIGLVLQLASLWLLSAYAELPYLPAAALATELAIVHNFFWHVRWTWADRAHPPARLRRFLFFNIGCAATAVASLLLMVLFVETLRMPYLAANGLSVVAGSLANFALGHLGVFRWRRVDRMAAAAVLLAGAAAAPGARAAELHPRTVAAFNRYVRVTEARMTREIGGTAPFLWIDRLPEAERREAYAQLRDRRIVVRRLETRDEGGSIESGPVRRRR